MSRSPRIRAPVKPAYSATPRPLLRLANSAGNIPLVTDGTLSPFRNSFDLLADRITALTAQQSLQNLLVMSAYAGDGRSMVAANLGLALGSRNRRVVLVDADIRNPSLGRLFGATEPRSHVRSQASVPIRRLHRGASYPTSVMASVGNLEVVVSISGIETLTNWNAISDLLRSFSALGELVIIDSSPCLSSDLPFLLASLVDGVIYLVRRRSQDISTQLRIRAMLKHIGANVVGSVYNSG